MKIIFFDIDKELIDIYRSILGSIDINWCKKNNLELYFITSDVEDLLNNRNYEIDCIVSPANSLGFMNGGIDDVYRRLFTGIEQKVVSKIKEVSNEYIYERYILPIGKTVEAETGDNRCKILIVSPTMILPGSIIGTNYVYKAFKAIVDKYKNKNLTIACPGMGTGVGRLPYDYSANQIFSAILDSYNIGTRLNVQ